MFNPSTFHKTVETGKRTDDHIRKAERALERGWRLSCWTLPGKKAPKAFWVWEQGKQGNNERLGQESDKVPLTPASLDPEAQVLLSRATLQWIERLMSSECKRGSRHHLIYVFTRLILITMHVFAHLILITIPWGSYYRTTLQWIE